MSKASIIFVLSTKTTSKSMYLKPLTLDFFLRPMTFISQSNLTILRVSKYLELLIQIKLHSIMTISWETQSSLSLLKLNQLSHLKLKSLEKRYILMEDWYSSNLIERQNSLSLKEKLHFNLEILLANSMNRSISSTINFIQRNSLWVISVWEKLLKDLPLLPKWREC